MSQCIPDMVTVLSGGFDEAQVPQAITDDEVSDDILQFPSSPQQIGLKGMVFEFLVTTTFTGMAEGFYFQIPADATADLDSAEIIVATSPLLQIADLQEGDIITVPVPAQILPSTYVYLGAFYKKHTNVATAGAVICSLKQGSCSNVTE